MFVCFWISLDFVTGNIEVIVITVGVWEGGEGQSGSATCSAEGSVLDSLSSASHSESHIFFYLITVLYCDDFGKARGFESDFSI